MLKNIYYERLKSCDKKKPSDFSDLLADVTRLFIKIEEPDNVFCPEHLVLLLHKLYEDVKYEEKNKKWSLANVVTMCDRNNSYEDVLQKLK